MADFMLVGNKLAKLGFTYYRGDVLILDDYVLHGGLG